MPTGEAKRTQYRFNLNKGLMDRFYARAAGEVLDPKSILELLIKGFVENGMAVFGWVTQQPQQPARSTPAARSAPGPKRGPGRPPKIHELKMVHHPSYGRLIEVSPDVELPFENIKYRDDAGHWFDDAKCPVDLRGMGWSMGGCRPNFWDDWPSNPKEFVKPRRVIMEHPIYGVFERVSPEDGLPDVVAYRDISRPERWLSSDKNPVDKAGNVYVGLNGDWPRFWD